MTAGVKCTPITPLIVQVDCEAFSVATLSFIGTVTPPGILTPDQSDTSLKGAYS